MGDQPDTHLYELCDKLYVTLCNKKQGTPLNCPYLAFNGANKEQ
jgi:hypothetical protein